MISYKSDYAYAGSRLIGSIVSLDKFPVLILNVGAGGLTSYRSIFTPGDKQRPLEDFDLSPLSLGYVNGETTAFYLIRQPSRQYRQGVRNGNLSHAIRSSTTGFISCINNRYPSWESVMDSMVNGECNKRAFNSSWAISKNRSSESLLYKDHSVGGFKGNTPTLREKYRYLSENLEEVVQ